MYASGLRCAHCNKMFPLQVVYKCVDCGGILEVVYNYERIKPIGMKDKAKQKLKNYDLLPVKEDMFIDMGEGWTPIVEANRLASQLGLSKVIFKCEFTNPTGSFKDRPISIGVSKALEFGYSRVVIASSGNAATAAAAYAARAGLKSIVLVPESTPAEKIKQAAFYGACVIRVRGPYSNCFNLAKEAAEHLDLFNLTTTFINPYTVEGNKTIAFELVDQLNGLVPDYVFVPIGSGPMMVGIYRGYVDYAALGLIESPPRMVGVQAEGCDPIARAFAEGAIEVEPLANPKTIAGGICDGLWGYADDGTHTLNYIRRSEGYALAVSDEEIKAAQIYLAQKEGLFVEPSGAAGVAGLVKSAIDGMIGADSCVVVILSGHGLKDMRVLGEFDIPVIDSDVRELIKIVEG